jgi:hypothetical protein
MAPIFVTRDKRAWRDRLRKYRIVVDGRMSGKIARAETVVIDVPPGEHQVELRLDVFAGSRPLTVSVPSDGVHLVCGPNYETFPLLATVFALFRPKQWAYLKVVTTNTRDDPP